MRTMGWMALWLVAAGCTGDVEDGTNETGTEDCTTAGMALTLGSGVTAFTALSDNEGVTIIHGPQGGWHIDVAGLVSNTGQEVSILPRFTVVATGEQIAGDQQPTLTALASYDDATCTGEFFGVRAFVDDAAPVGMSYQEFICGLSGEGIELTVDIEDFGSGNTTTSTLMLTAERDAVDQANCP